MKWKVGGGTEIILNFLTASKAKVIKSSALWLHFLKFTFILSAAAGKYKLFVFQTRCSYNILNCCKNCFLMKSLMISSRVSASLP